MHAKFREALDEVRRGKELNAPPAPPAPPWPAAADGVIAEIERKAGFEDQLAAVENRVELPTDPHALCGIAEVALEQQRNLVAANLLRDALARAPDLGAENDHAARYNAACAALRVSRREGDDTQALSDAERAEWRRQGLAWLQEIFEHWRSRFDDGTVTPFRVREVVWQWRNDPDVASYRAGPLLESISDSEQREWQQLWFAIDELEAEARK